MARQSWDRYREAFPDTPSDRSNLSFSLENGSTIICLSLAALKARYSQQRG
jgi:hypothetical protein